MIRLNKTSYKKCDFLNLEITICANNMRNFVQPGKMKKNKGCIQLILLRVQCLKGRFISLKNNIFIVYTQSYS